MHRLTDTFSQYSTRELPGCPRQRSESRMFGCVRYVAYVYRRQTGCERGGASSGEASRRMLSNNAEALATLSPSLTLPATTGAGTRLQAPFPPPLAAKLAAAEAAFAVSSRTTLAAAPAPNSSAHARQQKGKAQHTSCREAIWRCRSLPGSRSIPRRA
jgi:hypothetical protein